MYIVMSKIEKGKNFKLLEYIIIEIININNFK